MVDIDWPILAWMVLVDGGWTSTSDGERRERRAYYVGGRW